MSLNFDITFGLYISDIFTIINPSILSDKNNILELLELYITKNVSVVFIYEIIKG